MSDAPQSAKDRNRRVLSASFFIEGLFTYLVQAVWQPFVLSLGAPMSTLGLLESIGGPKMGIVSNVAQLLGGWLSDRRGRKPIIVLGAATGVLSMGFCLLAAGTRQWRWLVPSIILMGLALIARAAAYSAVAESVRVGRRGMAFGMLLLAWTVPGIFAPPAGGWIAGRWGFSPVFALRLLLEALRLGLVVWLLRETLEAAGGAVSRAEFGGMVSRIVRPPRVLRGLYWAMAIDTFAWGMGGALLVGMLSKTYGFTTVQLGLMASLFCATMAAAQLPAGRLIDRYGSRPLLAFSEASFVCILIACLFSRSFGAFAALYGILGIIAATWVPAQQAFLSNSVPAAERGEAIGRLAAFQGVLAFPAPFLGGLLYDRFGFAVPIVANLVGAMTALAVIILVVKERPAAEWV
jgi:DHA1 family multidrug resistance protein-like MFS transporter